MLRGLFGQKRASEIDHRLPEAKSPYEIDAIMGDTARERLNDLDEHLSRTTTSYVRSRKRTDNGS